MTIQTGHKNHQGLGQSLLEALYVICFTAGLSKLRRRQKPRRQRSFCHFQRFYSLTALLKELSQFYDIFFIICTFMNNDFYPHRLFAALTSAGKKICAPSDLRLDGVV
jgi:hypothetical protein